MMALTGLLHTLHKYRSTDSDAMEFRGSSSALNQCHAHTHY